MVDIDRLCTYVDGKRCVRVKVRSYVLRLPYLSALTQFIDNIYFICALHSLRLVCVIL